VDNLLPSLLQIGAFKAGKAAGYGFVSLLSKFTNMKTIGIVILALGIIMTVFTGFNIITRKKVVDVGPIEINKTEKTPVYWSPVTGGILIAIGALVLVADNRKRA
jgi:hypothetical protein